MQFYSFNVFFNTLVLLNCQPISHCDAAENWQVGFQDPATPIMEGIINLHHDLMFFIVVVSVFVS